MRHAATLPQVPTAPARRLAAAADLAAGLAALGTALHDLPDSPGLLQRVEVPLVEAPAPLDLPAGFPVGCLDPLMLLGPSWSGAGAVIDRDAGSPDCIEPLPSPFRLALTCRFDPGREAAPGWRVFGRCRTWLPIVELDGEAGLLALNWRDPGDRGAVGAALARWRDPVRPAAPPPAVVWRADRAGRDAWRATVTAALARIADTDALPLLRKIVPARRLDGRLDEAVHPAALLRAARIGSVGWPWWLQRGDRSWLGETPELLGAREGRRLRTLALAGTRPRHADPERDATLGADLLASDKDRREQAAVADWLHGQLARLAGRAPAVGDLELRRLPSLQHLGRALEVSTDAPLADAAWLDALHPTPALCGAPRREVRAWLRAAEPFDRGLYGGIVGWLEADRAEAHVAIRGLQLAEREVSVYVGAGVVRGSDPAREWEETAAKANAVCRRLGLAPPVEVPC